MAGVNTRFASISSIKLSFTGFLLEMSRLSVFEIASCVYTKTIILFNLGE